MFLSHGLAEGSGEDDRRTSARGGFTLLRQNYMSAAR